MRMGLDEIMILKERQQQEWAFDRELMATEGAPTWKEVLSNVRDTFVVVLEDDDDPSLGAQIVEGRRSSKATSDFEEGLKVVGAAPIEALVNYGEQVDKDMHNT